jgi:nucleotide-binding universal stress UspA family protein
MSNYQVQKILTLANSPRKSLHAALWADQIAASFQSKVVLYDAVHPALSVQGFVESTKLSNYCRLLQSSSFRMNVLAQHITRAREVRHISELNLSIGGVVKQACREGADLIIVNPSAASKEANTRFSAIVYGSTCPVFIGRSGKVPATPKKLLVPVRLKAGLEQKIPVVIAWAKAFNAKVLLSAFEPYSATTSAIATLSQQTSKFKNQLQAEGITVQTDTVHGTHFGRAILHNALVHEADMLVVAVDRSATSNEHLHNRMGHYFINHSPLPVLAVPINSHRGNKSAHAVNSI